MREHICARHRNRYNLNSTKWNYTDIEFGQTNLLPMWIADMDFIITKETIRAMRKRVKQGVFGYTRISEEYRLAIKEWLFKKRNLNIDSSWIVCTIGVMSAIKNLIYSLTEKGDKVLVQSPVYNHFISAIIETGRIPIMSKLVYENDEYCMDFDDLDMKFSNDVKVMLLCNPHNPIGRVWREEELDKLGQLCEFYNIKVISDEIHADIVFSGNKFNSIYNIKSIDKSHAYICSSFSKTFNIAGLTMGFTIIADAKMKGIFRNVIEKNGANQTNVFGLLASQVSIQKGDNWHFKLMKYLQENLYIIEKFFSDKAPFFKLIKPEGTYLVWIDCRVLHKHLDSADFFTNIAKVAVSDGRQYGEGGEGFQRMNIACSKRTLKEAMRRIEVAYKKILNRYSSQIN